MSDPPDIDAVMGERGLRRRSELVEAGFTQSRLREAVARNKLVPVSHGVYATPEVSRHPLLDDAIICLISEGVICSRSAAMRHGLSDDVPDLVEVIVAQNKSRPPVSLPVSYRRTMDRRAFTAGVSTEMVGGVAVRMTDRARTVVDQYRFGVPEHHAIQALHTYLGEGGNGNALLAMDRALGSGVWKTMQRDVGSFGLANDRIHAREPHRQDEPGHDDGAGGPGLRRAP